MNKQEIYNYLTKKNIKYEITEHKAVYNMEELAEVKLPHPEADAKNLFVRDDKRQNYYLITIKGEKEELSEILGLIPGAVTPLGLLNDKDHRVKFYLDNDFKDMEFIGVHPNDNTATVWLSPADLIRLLKENGNEIYTVKL